MMLMIDAGLVQMMTGGALATTAAVQFYYHLTQFSTLAFREAKAENSNPKLPPVSVVVCARNEIKNLKAFLPSVLDQDYPDYQVVVVNDCSWDESGAFLEEMEDAWPQLKVVTIQEQEKYQHGKKLALTLGIKGAAHNHLLLTDADCRPSGRGWIRAMAAGFKEGRELVIGYGAYEKAPGFLNRLIRYDAAMNAQLYLSRALKGKAYMGVGRNLAYTRELFFRHKGFAKHYHLLSGDDDLFVNESATPSNTSVVVDKQSFTYSKAKESLGAWFRQKKRHMSAGVLYKQGDRRLIGGYHATHFLYWMLFFLAWSLKLNPNLIVTTLVIRLLTLMIISWKGFSKLGETDLLILQPVLDVITAIIYPFLAVSNLLFKPRSW